MNRIYMKKIIWLFFLCSIATSCQSGTDVLVKAVKSGDIKTVRLLIADGANINYSADVPLLMMAIENKDYSMTMELLKAGADVNKKSNDGGTPLIYSVLTKQEVITRVLIDKNVDINATDNAGFTALMWASGEGFVGMVELLIENGADVTKSNKNGNTALHLVARRGYANIAKILLTSGANINASYNGITPLMAASIAGHIKTVDLLLKNGADKEVKSKIGKTAYMYAVESGNNEVANILNRR